MFAYTSTTIINSDKDLMSEKPLFTSTSADDNHGNILRIKREYTFEMPGITKVYKKVASLPTFAEVTIDCDKLIEALPDTVIYPLSGRLAIYIQLEGSEESGFANDFYQKGLPFSVGFVIKDENVTGEELATQMKNVINRFAVSTVVRKLFDATTDGAVLTLKCTDEYMRFKTIAVLADLGLIEREIAHRFDGELDNDTEVITIVDRGVNGFGTFRHLMKDLRLPTAMNTSWTALYKTDKPVPGALYNQYTLYYQAPSMTNPSLVAVGDKTLSRTMHIFWVNQTISDEFEGVVAEVVGNEPVKGDHTVIFEEV